ncbi:MAG: Gfo/Idh/MocA family oxidoreductase [Armatimonadetes bacterium]|nr:Gfo/Idh/MocA family oxidoreductase [Armatimonadota bacterium]
MQQAVFGVIGLGHIAQSQHLPNIMRVAHIRLKAICDLDEGKIEDVHGRYPVPVATKDMAEIFADDEIQAVVVATKEESHVPLTVAALEAGKSVYVEKPLAETPEECEQVVAAQQRTGKFVAVGLNRRFAPAYAKAKQVIDSHGGAWNIHYRVSDDYHYSWGRFSPPGVRVIHEVCHIFDVIRWLTGSEVESVYCAASRADDEFIAMKMTNGCVVTIMDSGYATTDVPKERLEVITKRGAVTVEDFVELRTFGSEEEEPVYRFAGHTHPDCEFSYSPFYEKIGAEALFVMRRTGWKLQQMESRGELDDVTHTEAKRFYHKGYPGLNYTVNKGWIPAMSHFAECVLTGSQPMNAGPEDGLQASRLAQAAIQSRETGMVVPLS